MLPATKIRKLIPSLFPGYSIITSHNDPDKKNTEGKT